MPAILFNVAKVPFYFGGTSLLILVGVAIDTMAQAESFMISQRYDTAYKARGKYSGAGKKVLIMKKHLILLGAPGSGKGTQSAKLKEAGYSHVSTGDLLRGEIAKGSDLGNRVKEVMDKGSISF
jgi:hypothetical protein